MSVQLPDLPYDYDALAPVISGSTLRVHYDKHHRGYVDNLNKLIRDTPVANASLEEIVQWAARHAAADRKAAALFNNAAQAWNHAFYWLSLRPPNGGGPTGALTERITSSFGGLANFSDAYKSAASGHFGSGWAWLVLDGKQLKIVTTANADTPIVHGQTPLLVIDVWEHAYYLDYQQRRAAYVEAVVDQLLDWEFADRNYAKALGQPAGEAAQRSGTTGAR
ncbi:MAG: superoxide dismutase [Thiohalobacteraceae bacterium]